MRERDGAPAELREHLLQLELALASHDPTGIDGGLMGLIADDFVEFGRSGRVWDRTSIRTVLEDGAVESVAIEDLGVHELADGIVLVTYRTRGAAPCLRSSIWVRRGERWQIRFHQGTRT